MRLGKSRTKRKKKGRRRGRVWSVEEEGKGQVAEVKSVRSGSESRGQGKAGKQGQK